MGDDRQLVVSDLCAGYGSMRVVHDVSFTLGRGEVVALVGRNGAGKSTTLSAVAGLREGPASGTITLDGADIFSTTASKLPRAGFAFVPEGHRVFAGMTVVENLRLGAYPRKNRSAKDLAPTFDRVYELFPALKDASTKMAEQLSGGQQQMLAIGQALMAEPRYLLLDEPCAGLAPAVVDLIYTVVGALAAQGHGVLVVEQDVLRAMARSDRTYVMDQGRIVISGESSVLRHDPSVLDVIRGALEGDDDLEDEDVKEAGS